MIQITVGIDQINYENAVSVIVPLFIKNDAAAKATEMLILSKLKNKTQAEKDLILKEFIEKNKDKVIKTVNNKANKDVRLGYLLNIDADII